jgi:predicted  nucleic acid-binding Zn-ribbon protein
MLNSYTSMLTNFKSSCANPSIYKKSEEKRLSKHRVPVVIIMVILLSLANLKGLTAQAQGAMSTFFQRDYVGLSVRVDATQEIVPGENLAVRVSVTCTAIGVNVENFNLAVYGFRNGREKIQLNAFEIIRDSALTFNSTYESRYNVSVPNEVWGPIYAELQFKYTIHGTEFADEPSFAITTVRNVNYEQLQRDFEQLQANFNQLNASYNLLNSTYWTIKALYAQLNASYEELNSQFTAKSASYEQLQQNFNKLSETYSQLESSYGQLEDLYAKLNAVYNELTQNYTGLDQNYTELNQNYTILNATYAKLDDNFTSLQGSLDEAAGTRQVTLVLGVMTALFVGTTVFLLIRKPKQYYW